MTNKRLDKSEEIMREISTLLDRSTLQIVNAMRHIELNKAGHEAIRRVDQLTRALEYLCEVKEYNKVIERKLRGLLSTNQKQKQLIQELQEGTNLDLEGFGDLFLENVNKTLGLEDEVAYQDYKDNLSSSSTVKEDI